MKSETLEILIGKYLDGEITPAEQRVLETELKNNPHAGELLEQLRDLHEQTRQALASGVIERGKPPDDIFERAWRQRARNPLGRIIRVGGSLRFAAGLAAGLVIGLALHFTLLPRPAPQIPHIERVVAVPRTADDAVVRERTLPNRSENVTRNVDWYGFTDENGVRWLVEGYRENTVRPAVYETGL